MVEGTKYREPNTVLFIDNSLLDVVFKKRDEVMADWRWFDVAVQYPKSDGFILEEFSVL